MLSTLLLVSALAMSAVLGRSSGLASNQLTYKEEDKTVMQSEETAQIMTVGDRSSNLKYVMAIKSSSIWEDIKKRSLTINTSQGLDDMVTEKSPDNLSDQELAQLRQACQDGLKCVAVDHLLVLEQVNEQLGGGKVSVRTVITKITQVLTQYTTEYQEDVYEYEAINDSDDESKVYKSVTTIVEDNKELCQIDLTPVTEESYPKNDESNAVPTLVVNNNNTVNYNTTENYNINNGTFNSATINNQPYSEGTDDGRTKIDSENRSPDNQDINADHQSTALAAVDEFVTSVPENDAGNKLSRQNYALDSGTSDQLYEPVTITNQYPENTWSIDDYSKPVEPATNNQTVLSRSNRNDAPKQTVIQKTADDGVDNNTIRLNNSSGGTAGGVNDIDSDFVSAGSNNKHSTRKGMVEDGVLNNGNMKVSSTDNSNRNKGTIKNANTNNGIINVGTTNNGQANYGTSDNYTNNGTMLDANRYDMSQFVNNIDKMYSTILNEFAKN